MDTQPEATPEPEATVETIAMVRDPNFYDAPHSADVHPDEVENYHVGGWVLADGAAFTVANPEHVPAAVTQIEDMDDDSLKALYIAQFGEKPGNMKRETIIAKLKG